MMTTKKINVEVAFALKDKQSIISLSLPEGSCALDAIKQSNIAEQFVDIDLDNLTIGIFGKITKLQTILKEYDRVEIYRPLIADPKEVRRARAEAKKQEQNLSEN